LLLKTGTDERFPDFLSQQRRISIFHDDRFTYIRANASEKPVLYEMTVRYFGSQPLAYDDECEATYGWRTGFDRSSSVQAFVGSGVSHRKTFHGLCGCARSLRQISSKVRSFERISQKRNPAR